IANAIHDAVGVRLDALPFTPERVRAALRANAGAWKGVGPRSAARAERREGGQEEGSDARLT
ncbi:MAG: hypothetical protein IT373_11110, partial [Polyangiaceae bacterium]|nr:hypothetical protein [Polyangiaceae bacterium]